MHVVENTIKGNWMIRRINLLSTTLILMLLPLFTSLPLVSATQDTYISSCNQPYVINSSGTYLLNNDLYAQTYGEINDKLCIKIVAPTKVGDVILDCQGHKITGSILIQTPSSLDTLLINNCYIEGNIYGQALRIKYLRFINNIIFGKLYISYPPRRNRNNETLILTNNMVQGEISAYEFDSLEMYENNIYGTLKISSGGYGNIYSGVVYIRDNKIIGPSFLVHPFSYYESTSQTVVSINVKNVTILDSSFFSGLFSLKGHNLYIKNNNFVGHLNAYIISTDKFHNNVLSSAIILNNSIHGSLAIREIPFTFNLPDMAAHMLISNNVVYGIQKDQPKVYGTEIWTSFSIIKNNKFPSLKLYGNNNMVNNNTILSNYSFYDPKDIFSRKVGGALLIYGKNNEITNVKVRTIAIYNTPRNEAPYYLTYPGGENEFYNITFVIPDPRYLALYLAPRYSMFRSDFKPLSQYKPRYLIYIFSDEDNYFVGSNSNIGLGHIPVYVAKNITIYDGPNPIYRPPKGKLFIKWYTDIHVIDQSGNPVSFAEVKAYNRFGNLVATGQTDRDGWLRLELTDYYVNVNGTVFYNPYKFIAFKDGQATGEVYANITTNYVRNEGHYIELVIGGEGKVYAPENLPQYSESFNITIEEINQVPNEATSTPSNTTSQQETEQTQETQPANPVQPQTGGTSGGTGSSSSGGGGGAYIPSTSYTEQTPPSGQEQGAFQPSPPTTPNEENVNVSKLPEEAQTQVLDISQDLINVGKTTLWISKGGRIQFNYKGQHSIVVNDLDAFSVDITVFSNPQTFVLYFNKPIKIDLDADNKPDIELELQDINLDENKAQISIAIIKGGVCYSCIAKVVTFIVLITLLILFIVVKGKSKRQRNTGQQANQFNNLGSSPSTRGMSEEDIERYKQYYMKYYYNYYNKRNNNNR